MNQFFVYVAVVLACVVLWPMAVFCIECWLAWLPARRTAPRTSGARARVVVLMPAHDEEAAIEATARETLSQLNEGDRLLVIADNCSDQTAAIARRTGAWVLEREDTSLRGKSHALAFGLRELERAGERPDVVMVIDADCQVAPGAIECLAETCVATGRPVQARYLFEAPSATNGAQAVSSLGLRFKNQIRPLGLSRAGLPCQLLGSGMAFPWPVIRQVAVDNHALAEDTQLGIDLVLQGHPPKFCDEAHVTTFIPWRHRAHVGQRTRWEHGYLMVMLTQAPRLLASFLRRGNTAALAAAIDFTVPPLALLAMIWFTATTASLLLGVLTHQWLPVQVLLGGGAVMSVTALACWARFCRTSIPVAALLTVPLYIVRKAPIYGSFLWKRQKVWLRTERDPIQPVRS